LTPAPCGPISAASCILLLVTLIWPDAAPAAAVAGLAVASGVLFAAAQGLLYVRDRSLRRYRAGEARDAAFRDVLAATLRGALDEAEQGCRTLLSRDPDDVEAALHLALLARRAGRTGEAARLLRRARFLDDTGRWDFRLPDRAGPGGVFGRGAVGRSAQRPTT